MAIQFKCDGCGQSYSVPEKSAGKSAKCRKCGGTMKVPDAVTEQALPELDEFDLLTQPGAGLSLASLDESELTASASPGGGPLGPGPAAKPAPARPMPARAAAGGPLSGLQAMPWWIWVAAAGGGAVLLLMIALVVLSAGRRKPPNVPVVQQWPTESGQPGSGPAGPNPPTRPSSLPPDPGQPGLPSRPPRRFPRGEPEPAIPAVEWTATVDPPAEEVVYLSGTQFEVQIPNMTEVVFPPAPNPYVLLLSRDFQTPGIKVCDLRTGEDKWSLPGKYELESPALLSPDGQYVAASASVMQQAINVLSLAENRMVARWEMPQGDRITSIRFAGPRRLAIGHERSRSWKLTLWEFLDNRQHQAYAVETRDFRQRCQPESLTISAQGKYAAFVAGATLTVVDLSAGTLAGASRIPDPIDPVRNKCSGLSFSQDGSHLAGVFGSGKETQIVCWDFSTGEIASQTTLDRGEIPLTAMAGFFQGMAIEWLPGDGGWLVGAQIMVDRQSGRAVWNLPFRTPEPRRFLDLERILAVQRRIGGIEQRLAIAQVPLDQIAAAVNVVRAGGTTEDATLPPLTEADSGGTSTVEQPAGDVAWSVQPIAGPTEKRLPTKPTPLGQECRGVIGLQFSDDGSRLAVLKQREHSVRPAPSSPAPFMLEAFELPLCQQAKQIPLTTRYQLLDVSSDGNLALVGIHPQEQPHRARLDVYDLVSGKHVVGWRPYRQVEEERHREVAWAAFADPEHVLTVNPAGRLLAWKLPECRALWAMEGMGMKHALDPGQKHFAGWCETAKAFRVYQTATGRCVGQLQTPETARDVRSIAFRSDGAMLAAAMLQWIVGWDVTGGKIQWQAPLPNVYCDSLDWRRSDCLLLGNRYLFDSRKRMLVWEYAHLMNGCHAAVSPDGHHWFCAMGPETGRAQWLGAIQMPSQYVQQRTAALSPGDRTILSPGARVSVSVSVPGSNRQAVLDAISGKLRANGAIVDPAGPVRLALTAVERNTGNTLELREVARLPGRGSETFPEKEIVCTLTVSRGSLQWKTESRVGMRTFGTVSGDVSSQTLYQQMRDGVASHVQSIRIPKYVVASSDKLQLERTAITVAGETPAPRQP